MKDKSWNIDATRMVYHQFGPGEAFVAGLERFALEHGIREAAVTSCIGSLRQLNLRNLCRFDEGNPEFERSSLNENLELVSAEGYIQPLPDSESGIRVHIHLAAGASVRRDDWRTLRRSHNLHRRVSVLAHPRTKPADKKSRISNPSLSCNFPYILLSSPAEGSR